VGRLIAGLLRKKKPPGRVSRQTAFPNGRGDFRKMGTDVTVHVFELSLAKADGTTVGPSLMVDGRLLLRATTGDVVEIDFG
jgi:hypothetical protein